jgi:hypothetical protein
LLNDGETTRTVDLLHILNLAEGKTVGDKNKNAQASQRKDFFQGHCLQTILMAASIICDAEVPTRLKTASGRLKNLACLRHPDLAGSLTTYEN